MPCEVFENKNVAVCGSIMFDRIIKIKKKFKLGEKQNRSAFSDSYEVKSYYKGCGGTAGNIARNLGFLGNEPIILGQVGNDFSGYMELLIKAGVDVSEINVLKNEKTASITIITDSAGNQQFFPYFGKKFKLDYYYEAARRVNVGLAIISPDLGCAPMLIYARIFKERGIPYIFDPGQQMAGFTDDELRELIYGCKIFIGNEYEINTILRRIKMRREDLREKIEYLIITKGGRGSTLYQMYHGFYNIVDIYTARPKKEADPTGAGDAFRAGFIYGLLAGLKIETSMRLGSTVASYAVEKNGTQNHKFTRADIINRHYKNFGERIVLRELRT